MSHGHKESGGEAYEGAWWRWLNAFNYTSTYYLSLLYVLTGDRRYGERAKEVILTYTKYYPDYEVHGDIPYNNPGKANSQTLDDEELIRHALYGRYGLYDQLEKGMLKDGFWFECSSCYHFFALMNFFMFEKFTVHTKWSNIRHGNYRKMILFACKLLESNYRIPMLNDCQIYQGDPDAYEVFEFAYGQMREKEMLAVLQHKYRNGAREGGGSIFLRRGGSAPGAGEGGHGGLP